MNCLLIASEERRFDAIKDLLYDDGFPAISRY